MTGRLLFLVLLAVAVPANGWPVLGEGRATPGGYCYPDHEEQRVWWLAPTTVGIKDVDGLPAVDLTCYRYQGSRATDDSGRFYGGTLLQFTLAFEAMADGRGGGRICRHQPGGPRGGGRAATVVRCRRLAAEGLFAGSVAGGDGGRAQRVGGRLGDSVGERDCIGAGLPRAAGFAD